MNTEMSFEDYTNPGCNQEGYKDPTAYLAIRNVEREQEKSALHIVYRNGQMMLRLEEFFPCTLSAARKIFPLINSWAGETEKENLRQYLLFVIGEKDEQIREIEEKIACYNYNQGAYRRMHRALSGARTMRKRAERNLSFLEGNYGGDRY